MSEVKKDETLELKEEPLRRVLQRFNEDLGTYINDDQRNKLGRVLTIIDASISDPTQRKAIKDLVQGQWWSGGGDIAGAVPTRGGDMSNPHTDLRAICQLFGFELYPPEGAGAPLRGISEDHYEQWAIKRYSKVANE